MVAAPDPPGASLNARMDGYRCSSSAKAANRPKSSAGVNPFTPMRLRASVSSDRIASDEGGARNALSRTASTARFAFPHSGAAVTETRTWPPATPSTRSRFAPVWTFTRKEPPRSQSSTVTSIDNSIRRIDANPSGGWTAIRASVGTPLTRPPPPTRVPRGDGNGRDEQSNADA